MKQIQHLTFLTSLFFAVCIFFCSASVLPVEGRGAKKEKKIQKQETKIKKIEAQLASTTRAKKKEKLQKRIKRVKYGERGDALGLAALLGGIVAILLSLAVLIFLGIEWKLLIFIGLLLGAAAIIFGIVDLRYTDMPGQAFAAIIAGGLAIVAGIIALIVVK